MTDYRCGRVTLVGRPNVGKSTLLNRLVGAKVSITSPRPQTTRQRLLGIKTADAVQIVYVDTPGLHPAQGGQLGQHMNRAARTSLGDNMTDAGAAALLEVAFRHPIALIANALGVPPPLMLELGKRNNVPVAALVHKALGTTTVRALRTTKCWTARNMPTRRPYDFF